MQAGQVIGVILKILIMFVALFHADRMTRTTIYNADYDYDDQDEQADHQGDRNRYKWFHFIAAELFGC